jgi:hypothetical protein
MTQDEKLTAVRDFIKMCNEMTADEIIEAARIQGMLVDLQAAGRTLVALSGWLDFPAQHSPEAPRDKVKALAQRTRKNLAHIERAQKLGLDVHQVTQLVLSVLGMVVFPYEDKAFEDRVQLRTLDSHMRTKWKIEEFKENLKVAKTRKQQKPLLPTETWDQLLKHLRNAIAHYRISFDGLDPNSHDYEKVIIRFEDQINDDKETKPYWKAAVSASNLRDFCFQVFDLVQNAE